MDVFETILKKYLDLFTDQEMYFVSDTRNLEFFEKNPANTTPEDPRHKIGSVDPTELTKQILTEDMVNPILKLNFDD